MSRFLYGIDFGTSNSVLSVYDEESQHVLKTITVPSILYFPDKKHPSDPFRYVVGNEAIQEYVNDGMKGRFMKSIKRVLPRNNFQETRIHNRSFTASDLVAIILKELKTQADAFTGSNVCKAVIGRPVFFDDDHIENDALAQKRLLKAAETAGFTDIRFQFEPIGAAFAYEKTILRKERVLVADFGGGTTDFTYVELDPEQTHNKDRRSAILATGGIYIGGDSFDSAFMWEKGTPYFGKGVSYESMPGKVLDVPLVYFTNICSWEKMNFFNTLKTQTELQKYYTYTKQNDRIKNLMVMTEHNLGYSIFQAIEQTKIELSALPESAFTYNNRGIHIDERISIREYDVIIEKEVQRISDYLNFFLTSNNIQPKDVDTLFLTGGTSLVHAVQAIFRRTFPSIPVKSEDHFISVAKGLAYCGYLFDE